MSPHNYRQVFLPPQAYYGLSLWPWWLRLPLPGANLLRNRYALRHPEIFGKDYGRSAYDVLSDAYVKQCLELQDAQADVRRVNALLEHGVFIYVEKGALAGSQEKFLSRNAIDAWIATEALNKEASDRAAERAFLGGL